MKHITGIVSLLLITQPLLAEQMQNAQQMNNAQQMQNTQQMHQDRQQSTERNMQMEKNMMETESDVVEKSTTAKPETHMMTEQSGFSRGSVVRSAFTTQIADREPLENIEKLSNENNKVMFFTELRDMSGQTAVHRWEHDGKVVAEVKFNVKGPRWRVWSSKTLMPQWTGDWKVSVINGAGEVIAEKDFNYVAASNSENQPEAEPAKMMQQEHMQEQMQ